MKFPRPLLRWLRPRPATLTAAAILLGLVLIQVGVPILDLIELKTYDLRLAARGERAPTGAVVMAVIDEESLDAEGRWPWPRTKLAALIQALSRDGAKVIAFDIGFLEPDEHSRGPWVAELAESARRRGIDDPRLEQLLRESRSRADPDEVLAEAIRSSDASVVLGYFFHMSPAEAGFTIAPEAIDAQLQRIEASKYPLVLYRDPELGFAPFLRAYAPEANLSSLSAAAAGEGYFSLRGDRDGVVRWLPLVIRAGDELFPPLSVAATWQYLDRPQLVVRVGTFGVDGIQIGDRFIATDESGQLLVNYLGPARTFPSVSVTRILRGEFEAGTFRDRMVLVGTTATGTYDLRNTPLGPVFPGLEIHATVADNILSRSFLERPLWSRVYDFLAIIVLGVLVGWGVARTNAVRGLIIAAALFAVHLLVAQQVLERYGVWLNVVYPLLTLATAYVALTLYSYVREERERRRITGTFGRYVAPVVVEEMLKDPDRLELGGEEKVLTVLFSDLQGFTSYTERYGPQEMIKILSDYYAAMTEEIFVFQGTLKEYVGDELMAIFGAPIDQADHARRACAAALAMRKRRHTLSEEWQKVGRPALYARTGVNSGSMLVGNLGSRYRFAYGVLGDDVNLGSRLEGLNKAYGTEILVGERTVELVGHDSFRFRELDQVRVVGKTQPTRVYELLGDSAMERSPNEDEAFAAYAGALAAYRDQDWEQATSLLKECLTLRAQDGPARTLLERCAIYRETPPPPDWDGVFEATSK